MCGILIRNVSFSAVSAFADHGGPSLVRKVDLVFKKKMNEHGLKIRNNLADKTKVQLARALKQVD